MGDAAISDGGSVMRRKRKRQVSWAAAELLEEVKVFHMAKPVNPSLPPPPIDDGGEADENDLSTQPGIALLGLFGTDTISASSSTTSALHSGKLNSSFSASVTPSAGDPPLSGDLGGADGVRDVLAIGAVGGGGGRAGTSNSSLFKGFQKTETVVRRKKLATPAGDEGGVHIHRYPKDIWPGHSPSNHTDSGRHNGARAGGATAGTAGSEAMKALEFFCDACDETIPAGTERMECTVCPDEFCLCHGCYDEAEVLDKRHEHDLLPSAAPFHITRPAPSAEAAAAAAAALHVTEEAASQDVYDDDLG